MPAEDFTDAELMAFLDEQLSSARMSAVEKAFRNSEVLRQRVTELIQRRDQGEHSVGEIWRRLRLSCPSRDRLGSYLLGALDNAHADYIRFHIETVGCRYCAANLHDLEQAADAGAAVQRRRQKYFASSAGYLSRGENKR